MKLLLFLLFLGSALFAETLGAAPESLYYMSEGKVRQGDVYKPKGAGPFPAVIFNQNAVTESDDKSPDPFAKLGQLFNKRGYVFFVPGRHTPLLLKNGPDGGSKPAKDEGQKWVVAGKAYSQDITTAMLSLKAQSYVDPNRIVIMGTIGGATASLFLAEQNMDIRGYVAFSPATSNWLRNPDLQTALKVAVEKAESPIFLIQPRNDASLGPSEVLGQILRRKGPPNRSKIYPAFGATPREAREFVTGATTAWETDVLDFVDTVTK